MGNRARNPEAQGKAGDAGVGVSEEEVVGDSGVSVGGI